MLIGRLWGKYAGVRESYSSSRYSAAGNRRATVYVLGRFRRVVPGPHSIALHDELSVRPYVLQRLLAIRCHASISRGPVESI